MEPCHYNCSSSEIYHYNSSILNRAITILHYSKPYHYVPLQCVSKKFWTKIPPSSTFHSQLVSPPSSLTAAAHSPARSRASTARPPPAPRRDPAREPARGLLVNRAPARELVARSGMASGTRRRSGEGGRAGSGQGESVGGEEPALGSSSGGERPEVELGVEELGGGHGGRRRSSGASRGGRRRGGRHCSQRGRAEPARTAARLRAPCAQPAASERRRRAGQRRRSRVSGTVAANAPS